MGTSNGDFQGDYEVYDMFAQSSEEFYDERDMEQINIPHAKINKQPRQTDSMVDVKSKEVRKHYDSVMVDNSYPRKNQMTFAKFIDDMETYCKYKEDGTYNDFPPESVGTNYYSGGYFTADDVEENLVDRFGSMLPSENFTATDPEELYYDRRTAAFAIMNDPKEFANQMMRFKKEYSQTFGQPYNHDVDYSSVFNDYLAKHPTNIREVKRFGKDDVDKFLDLDRDLPWCAEDTEDDGDNFNF